MQPIVSGSTRERVVRTSVVTALAVFASAYCFYDGYVGYPRENLDQALKGLDPPLVRKPPILPELNSSAAAAVEEEANLAHLKARWGEPGWQKESEVRYFGPAGQLVLTLQNDRVIKREYVPARYHTETDLRWQKGMGIGVGIAALALIVHWFRVILTRTTLTDQGIKTSGYPFVPFEAMTGLLAEQYPKKGWLDVEYSMNGQTGTIRLDDYKIKAFPAIMEEICRRKDFEDPYKKWQAEKAAVSSPPADT